LTLGGGKKEGKLVDDRGKLTPINIGLVAAVAAREQVF